MVDTRSEWDALRVAIGGLNVSVQSVTAAGTVQGDAAALGHGVNLVDSGDNAAGVILPAGVAGDVVVVSNIDAAQDAVVYPQTGGTINGGSANAGVTMGEGVSAIFVATAANVWTSAVEGTANALS